MIGEDEYKTEETLPAFAAKELEPLGIRCTFVIADPKTPHDFPGVEALDDADLLVLSVRRRAPTAEQMAIIRHYIDAGKPVVGIRTACHAFDTRGKAPPGHAEWTTFDPDVLGGHYTTHHPNTLDDRSSTAPRQAGLIRSSHGVETPFISHGSLYKVSPLAASTQTLLVGTVPDQTAGAGRLDQPQGDRVHLLSHRWATPTTSKVPRSAGCSRTPCSGHSTGRHPPRRRASPAGGTGRQARRPTAAAAKETHLPFDRGQGPLPPSAALASFKVPDDLQLELVLAEPIVRQPVSIIFDERGRLWVVQYLQYPVSRRV